MESHPRVKKPRQLVSKGSCLHEENYRNGTEVIVAKEKLLPRLNEVVTALDDKGVDTILCALQQLGHCVQYHCSLDPG